MKMSIVVSENEKTYQLLWYGIPIPSIVLFVYSISILCIPTMSIIYGYNPDLQTKIL